MSADDPDPFDDDSPDADGADTDFDGDGMGLEGDAMDFDDEMPMDDDMDFEDDVDLDGTGLDEGEMALDDDLDELAADVDDVGGEEGDIDGEEVAVDSEFDELEPGNEFESLDGEGDFRNLEGEFDDGGDELDVDGDGEFGGMEEDFDDELEFDDTGEGPGDGMEFDESADGLDDEMDFDDTMEFDDPSDDSMEFDEPGDVAPSGGGGEAGEPAPGGGERESVDNSDSVDESPGNEEGVAMSDEGEAVVDDAETGGESSGSDRATVEGLEGEQLADVLSQAWVNRGWETDVAEGEDGSFFVTGDQGNGQRGLILVLPGDVEVPGKRLQQYASLVKKKDVDVRVVATQGAFTDDAERIAKANNVHLLDPQAILETVEAEGLESELSRFASENGDGGGGIGAMIPSLPIPSVGLPSGVPLPSPGGKGLKSVLLIVLIATSLLAGFAGGAFLGPGGDAGVGGVAATMGGFAGGGGDDVAVAALSTAEPGNAGLTVHWNARTADSVVANGSTYEAPDESRFVVVELVVQNTGSERVPVKPGDFLVNANGTRYTHQPLDGTRTFEMTAVAPGNETTGWLVFAIPDDVNDAVLVPDTEAAGGPVTFVRDSSLTINGTG